MNMHEATKRIPSRRLARRLIYSLVLASSIITLFITAYQLYRDYSHDIGLIENRFTQIQSVYVPSLANAMWKTDQQEIMLQLAGMIRLPDIQYLSVWEKGKIIAEIGMVKDKNTITRRYPLQYEHRGELFTIGEFRVVATLDLVYQRLIDKVWVILISNGIKTFLIAGFMLFIFQQLVTRHIFRLADQVNQIDVADLDKHVSLDRKSHIKTQADELDILVDAFEGMRIKISEAFEKITRREEYLRRYESIMATTTDQMSFIDRNYVFRAVNSAYTKLFGKNVDEIIGQSVSDLLGQEYFDNVSKPNLDKAFAGKYVQFIASITDKDGHRREMEVNYYPYYDDAHQVQGAVVNARDITERVLAEQERLRNTQVYEALAQQGAIQFQTFIKNCLALLQDVFQSKYVIVGKLLPHSFQVRTEYVLISGQRAANFVYDLAGTPCEKIFDNKKEFIYSHAAEMFPEDPMLTEHGVETYFGSPLTDTRGFTMGILIVMDTKPHARQNWHEDILSVFAARIALELERADALAKLENYNEELESRVKERTVELENAIKDMEAFSYSVSHDLRTPLRAINGYSQILLEDNRDKLVDASVTHLQKIRQASEKMGELIDSLLKLSRIGRQPLELVKIDLSSMVRQSLSHISEQYGVKPEFIIDDGLSCIGDKGLIHVAIDNLVINAIKYSANSPEPVIEFGVQNEGDRLTYYIKDNGIGFDERYSAKLFEPFQRLHDESEYSGLGIGLATVRRIFLRHGGRIWAESEVNQGATFYFTLGELNTKMTTDQQGGGTFVVNQ